METRGISIATLVMLLTVAGAVAHGNEAFLDWATRAGGTGSDQGRGVASLAGGATIVSGSFQGSATFGQGESNQTTLISLGATDIFVAKYASDGSLVWVRRDGGSGDDESKAVAAYGDDSSVIGGDFTGPATFGLGEPNETTLTPVGPSDIFIAKYDSDGNLLWAKRAGGNAFHEGRAVDSLPDGGAVITGYFRNTSTFGQGEMNETVLNGTSENGFFTARYNANGTLAWAKQAVGGGSNAGLGIAGLSDGSAIVTGEFGQSATFGLGEINETIFSGPGPDQFVLAKYNADGTLAWAKRANGTGYDAGLDVTTLSDGSALVAGHIGYPSGGSATFGQGETNETFLSGDGTRRAFVARFAPDGTLQWVRGIDGAGEDSGRGIDSFSDGKAVVIGYFTGTATFGLDEPNETVLTSAGSSDVFIAEYDSNGTLLRASAAGGSGDELSDGVSLNSDGDAILAGRFSTTAVFGSGQGNQTTLSSAGSYDVFVAKYLLTSSSFSAPGLGYAALLYLIVCLGVFGTSKIRRT